MLEVALTLPAICALIFFAIELMKIHITQAALDAICAEATLLTVSEGSKGGPAFVAKTDAIIEKYRPAFIPQKIGVHAVIRYHFETYNSLQEMCAVAPYGGTDVHYPDYEYDAYNRKHGTPSYCTPQSLFLPSGDRHWHLAYSYWTATTNYLTGAGFPSGRVFVLTFGCAYQFSAPFIKRLFGGGVNTKKCTASCGVAGGDAGATANFPESNLYLLWARGVGIVN
jgi:hypothetical protein